MAKHARPLEQVEVVYLDSDGQHVTQRLTDLLEVGNAIDPVTDHELEPIGWRDLSHEGTPHR